MSNAPKEGPGRPNGLLETARTEYERGAGILPLDDDEMYENYAAVS